ncbi:MAG: hypothetical protein IPK50_19995 [Fibrobacterota bacterium]|nr:MAG: hypothetical protein IPK50_19995 [Fibrobacterota bacterium]
MEPVELTPSFVSRLLETVAHSGIERHQDGLASVPDGRRLPLFRASRGGANRDFDEDARRLCLSRGESLRRESGEMLEWERIARLERLFQGRSESYRPGHLLSLLRLALDIAQTEHTGLTVLEMRSLHLLERRLCGMQRTERPGSPEHVAGLLSDLASGDPWKLRGLCDLSRYLEEVTGHPFLGRPDQASLGSIQLLLTLRHSLSELVRGGAAPLGLVPLDVCLAARGVLANARILHLRMGALLDEVLSPELALWPRLGEWLSEVEHGRDATFQLPAGEEKPDFLVEGRRMRALDLVVSVAGRLERTVRVVSLDESFVALERTLHRRIRRQESRKHHLALLLRRVFERALHERNRRSMRNLTSGVATKRPERPALELSQDPVWAPLQIRAQEMEEAKAWGCSLAAGRIWHRIFPGQESSREERADLEEFLRWSLDCRGDLLESWEARTDVEKARLVDWFQEVLRRVEAFPVGRQKGFKRRRDRTTPLQWLTACLEVVSKPDAGVFWEQGGPGPAADEELVARALFWWSQRHPWDRGLFGIWNAEMRGSRFADGLCAGVALSRSQDVAASEVRVRLDMMERELEYRAWLGARERVALIRETLAERPAELPPISVDPPTPPFSRRVQQD